MFNPTGKWQSTGNSPFKNESSLRDAVANIAIKKVKSVKTPASRAELIRQHSKATVKASTNPYIVGYETKSDGSFYLTADGKRVNKWSRELTDYDAVSGMVKKYG